MLKIYTKTGDNGVTSLYGGKRVLKSDLRIEAYGNVDELNSLIGLILSQKPKREKSLIEIQKELFVIGSSLAGYKKNKQITVNSKQLENWIDELEKKLPVLRNFILPGGSKIGSLLHYTRTVCRRAERRVVELNQKQTVDKNIIIYLNRLSDLLFIMARFSNKKEGVREEIWTLSQNTVRT